MMSETTMELINAIESGDAVGIESTFNAAMAEKISGKIEAMRSDVAQNMFKTVTQQEPTETTTTEE
jgi:hypothetical protein